jgi:hypothetical protein
MIIYAAYVQLNAAMKSPATDGRRSGMMGAALRPWRSPEQLFFDRLSGGFSMAETGLRRFLLLLFVDPFELEHRGGPRKSAYGISCQ